MGATGRPDASSSKRRKKALNSGGEVNMAYCSEHKTNPAHKASLRIGSPPHIERRRATRHLFGEAAEVINVESQKHLISLTRDLSLYGCFVTCKVPFSKGTRVSLKIANSEANFSAEGSVAYNLSDEGMGIGFVRVEAKGQAVLEEWLAEAGANGVATRILIADDHEAVRRGVRSLLTRDALEICGEAENGKEALEKVRELKPDLVILDVSMPVMNGFEAAREIRRFAPRTKIVLFSVHDSPQIIEIAKRAGADAYVLKSAAGTDLKVTVKRLLQAVGHFGYSL
jgi:CheY-like chemotaxis protein